MHTPYQVLVVSADHGNTMVHCGPPAKQQLLLLAHDAHYDVITELNGYFGVILVYNAGKATRPRKEVPPYPRNKKELPSVKQLRKVTQRLLERTVSGSRAVQKTF